ncbi:MAG: class II aldolase/adducin family protein [Candidatus Brennerbacteria bacterium]|nr:class II aldolase/adducin family protein [Candidatus Brennerbacteria bacterium]
MEIKEKWLDGWVLDITENKSLMATYAAECHAMQLFGRKLFDFGVISKQGGNFAIRDRNNPNVFISTAHGVNKSKLRKSDFLIVRFINWRDKKVFVDAFDEHAMPSTDTLLMGQTFITDPELNTWVHFHKTVKTPHEIKMNYPVTNEAEMAIFTFMIINKVMTINLIDHDKIRKTRPDNQPDSAIILGKDYLETFQRTIKLIV